MLSTISGRSLRNNIRLLLIQSNVILIKGLFGSKKNESSLKTQSKIDKLHYDWPSGNVCRGTLFTSDKRVMNTIKGSSRQGSFGYDT